ncbi:lipopolysaccharide biosynthesis protein [Marinobacter adhaerens]|uniref:lipopolysaccharide biosynthesis protein n=1 Tax=Marinobacter adhaerens TaxID=1033846 RepID=UPI001E5F2C51|nr:hypothetical protein [Marinobacter adhaerens]MCD1648054.1 hypothetical protein [Marinobacter adhaerens]
MNTAPLRFLNLSLRGSTLASKFLLIFFLARYAEPAEVGLYGLIAVTVSYGLYFLGFDFYMYTTRELLGNSPAMWGRFLKSQVGLSVILYCIFLPASIVLFVIGLLPWWVLPWFMALLVLEHVTQELNRLLVALSRQLMASWVLFFRSGFWALVVVVGMHFNTDLRELETVLWAWIASACFAAVIGVYSVHRIDSGGWSDAIDWEWIHRGLKVAIPMLVATLALRGLYTIDRYWFESLMGLDVLGAYVLFVGICNALLSFMDAAVFTFLYPPMIAANASNDADEFSRQFRQLALQTVVLVILFSLLAWFAVGPLLQWLDRPLYSEHQYLFGWLLLANAFFILSMVPHFGLYARGKDGPIIASHLVGLAVFIGATALYSGHWPLLAVPYGLVTAFASILALKSWQFYRMTPQSWW